MLIDSGGTAPPLGVVAEIADCKSDSSANPPAQRLRFLMEDACYAT
jgi:hypothetical protein